MPLSEREQRILEDIERSLVADDPTFLHENERPPSRPIARDVKVGGLVFAGGVVLLIAFFVMRSVIVGVAAFGAMVAGMVIALGALRRVSFSRRGASWHDARRRVSGHFEGWERRLRDRYRRR